MHNVDRERVVAGLLNDDPEMVRRYHTSAVFRHRMDYLPAMLSALVEGMAEQADALDAGARAATAAVAEGHVLSVEDARRLFGSEVGQPVSWSGVIAVEGFGFDHDRRIAHGALHWTEPVWLRLPGERSGVVRRIWRGNGGLIRAEGDCEADGPLARLLQERGHEGVGVAVQIDQVEWVERRAPLDESLVLTKGRLVGVDVVEPPTFPAARIRRV